MVTPQHPPQIDHAYPRVALGRVDADVSQKLLNHPHRRAGLEEVGRVELL